MAIYNIFFLGLSFMLLFTAFQTCGMIEQTVIKSIKDTDKNFHGSGYTSLAIIYMVFAFSNWLAPSVVAIVGPRWSMFGGGILYLQFIASFIKPQTWWLYLGSVLVGIGAAVIWTAQGNFLTINSDSETISRNSGIFWAMLQCSLLFGNLYVYFEFNGKNTIEDKTRTIVFSVLTVIACLGVITFLLLRNPKKSETDNLINVQESKLMKTDTHSPLKALELSFLLFKTKEMVLLSFCFAYTGFELTFFSGVYGTCVGNTSIWGNKAKSYIGICGILIGAGEIIGGGLFGLLGKYTNRHGRDPIVLLGFIVHSISFYLVFINLPNNSPLYLSLDAAIIDSNEYIAFLCAFLLGLGDSCFNTQIYSILGFMFPEDSAPAFALFKFAQSLAAAAAFFYSSHLTLYWQLLILVISGFFGTLTFFLVEWSTNKASLEGYQKI